MKIINVLLMCLCSLFLFTGCYTNEFGEKVFVDNGEPDVSKEIDIETLINIHNGVDKFFTESATIDEMAKHLDEIKAMKGIAEAWTTDDALYVKTDDGITCFWLYPNDLQADEEDLYNAVKQMTRSIVLGDAEDHEKLKPQRIAIINQQSSDEDGVRVKRNKILNDLKDEFDKAGFAVVDYIDQKGADLDFFSSKIKEYDIIFLLTHGAYFPDKASGKHELLTGAEIPIRAANTTKKETEKLENMIKETLTNWRDGVSIGTVIEKELAFEVTDEGVIEPYIFIPKTYFTIDENFISKNIKGSLNDVIIFNAACQSLQGNDSLAYEFGAKTYIGYNKVSGYGPYAAYVFFKNMLEGLHVGDAFEKMEKDNSVYVHNDAELKIVGSENVCIIHPLVEATEPGEITSTTVELNGKMTEWRETLDKESSKVGFCWSSTDTDPKMDKLDNENFYVSCSEHVYSYDISDGGSFTFNGKMKYLDPNTTYFYRPFLYMNDEYYYGDVKEVMTKEDNIWPYLEKLYYDTDGDNWKYNDQWLTRTPVNEWHGVSVVHSDLYDMDLYEIKLNFNNLKGTIDLSGCTNLEGLYISGNVNITSLNLSGCTSLKYIDLDWDDNITSLNLSGCTSLERLTLYIDNLISLDVSGCTALEYLMCKNSNLTNLDLSGCTTLYELELINTKLTSLDVSGCTALRYLSCEENNNFTSINVSGSTTLRVLSCEKNNNLTSINASGCTALESLFCRNNKLTSLDVSGCTVLTRLECENNNIISEIPQYFKKFTCFSHDRLYYYYYDYDLHKYAYKRNKYGWYYPGEPESGKHDWSSSDAPRRQIKKK